MQADESTPAPAPRSRLGGRRLASAAAALGACALIASAALALSVRHALGVAVRVDRLHAAAPRGARSARLLVDAAVEQPRWSPHRVEVRGASCRLRRHGVDLVAEVPSVWYATSKRISFEAEVRAAAASAEAPSCEIASTVDLFGSGLLLPWVVSTPLAEPAGNSGAARLVGVERAGPASATRPSSLRNASVTLQQDVQFRAHLPAGSLPEPLLQVLGSAVVSLDSGFAYAEGDDNSLRFTKAVNASLNVTSDGQGGVFVSAPASLSSELRPAALAATLAKTLFGRSEPYPGAPPAERGSVDRAVRLVSEEPESFAAQYLGESHVVGWRSHSTSVVNDLVRGAKKRLGAKLARAAGANSTANAAQVPLMHPGRRLMEDTKMVLKETIYSDDDVFTVEADCLIGADRFELSAKMLDNNNEMMSAALSTKDTEEVSMLSYTMRMENVELVNVELTDDAQDGMSTFVVHDMDGRKMADFSVSESKLRGTVWDVADGSEVFEVKISDVDDVLSFEVSLAAATEDPHPEQLQATASLDRSGDDTTGSFSVKTFDTWTGQPSMEASGSLSDRDAGMSFSTSMKADGEDFADLTMTSTRDGDSTSTTISVNTKEEGQTKMQMSVSIQDNYGQTDGFSLDATMKDEGETQMSVGMTGTHASEEFNLVVELKDSALDTIMKLNPLVLGYSDARYALSTSVFDSENEEIVTVSFALTNDNQPVDIDFWSPMDSSFDFSGSLSFPTPDEGMSDIPCMQGTCQISMSVQDQHLSLELQSFDGGQTPAIHPTVELKTTDTEWNVGGQLLLDGATSSGSITLNNGGSPIAMDKFVLASTGTIRDHGENKQVLSWTLNMNQDSTTETNTVSFRLDGESQSDTLIQMDSTNSYASDDLSSSTELIMESTDDEGTQGPKRVMKWDVSMTEPAVGSHALDVHFWDEESKLVDVTMSSNDGTPDSSMSGDVKIDGERFIEWDGKWTDAGVSGTGHLAVYDKDGWVATIYTSTTDDESTGVMGASANFSQDGAFDFLDDIHGVVFQTLDHNQRVSAFLGVLDKQELAFANLTAFMDFTSQGSDRLLSDFVGSVNLSFRAPDAEDKSDIDLRGFVGATSSGGEFSMCMGGYGSADDSDGDTFKMSGTSSADRIAFSGNLFDDANLPLDVTFEKADGRMDVISSMKLDFTLELKEDGAVVHAGVMHDGGDLWGVGGTVEEAGSNIFTSVGYTNGDWVSLASWIGSETMNLEGVKELEMGDHGFIYEYFNASLFAVDISPEISQMWEIQYMQMDDFITTSNWSMRFAGDDDLPSQFSVLSFAKEKKDGVWKGIFDFNFTSARAKLKQVTGNFQIKVPTAKAAEMAEEPKVKQAFAAAIAEEVGVEEDQVEVRITVVTGGGRRLTSSKATLQVAYTITLPEPEEVVSASSLATAPSSPLLEVPGAATAVALTPVVDMSEVMAVPEAVLTEVVMGQLANLSVQAVTESFQTELEEISPDTASELDVQNSVEAVEGSASQPVVEDVVRPDPAPAPAPGPGGDSDGEGAKKQTTSSNTEVSAICRFGISALLPALAATAAAM